MCAIDKYNKLLTLSVIIDNFLLPLLRAKKKKKMLQ